MLTTDTRSQKGCWTCRARRKKCDERPHSTCFTCESLQLKCHGYGPRPDWMDGGSKERAKVSEFKNAVKQGAKFRKRPRNGKSLSEAEVLFEQQYTQMRDHRILVPDTASFLQELDCSPLLELSSSGSHHLHAAASKMPLGNVFQDFEMDLFKYPICQSQTTLGAIGVDTSNGFSWDLNGNQEKMNHGSMFEFPVVGTDYQTSYVNSSPHSTISVPMSELSLDIGLGTFSAPVSESSLSNGIGTPVAAKSLAFPESLGHLAVHELSAIRFYIEDVLPEQFHFLDIRTIRACSTQLLELAGVSKFLLPAIMSHGLYRKASELSKLDPGSTARSSDSSAERYEASVLEYIYASYSDWTRTEIGPTDPHDELRNVEITVCITLQILSMFERKDDAWIQLLQLAVSIPALDFKMLRNQRWEQLWPFQTMLICVDILARATTGTSPCFALNFRDDFCIKDKLRCEDVIGCETSVMRSIMNIAELQSWKTHETANESISVIFLAKCALEIEPSLQSSREANMRNIENHSILASSIKESWNITHVFACAATVYLHAAVSGCCPDVPGIKIIVSDTIEAITMLPRFGMLRRLMWPLCVAACLADETQRQFFAELERGLGEEIGTAQNVVRALRIGRECGRLRMCGTSRRRIVDWMDAMASLNDRVPLVF